MIEIPESLPGLDVILVKGRYYMIGTYNKPKEGYRKFIREELYEWIEEVSGRPLWEDPEAVARALLVEHATGVNAHKNVTWKTGKDWWQLQTWLTRQGLRDVTLFVKKGQGWLTPDEVRATLSRV